MPRHTGLTLGVASLVGTTVGCVILWKLINRRRRQCCVSGDVKDSCAILSPETTGSDNDHQKPSEVEVSSSSAVEKILNAEIKIVSMAEEWEAVWPTLKKDLDVFPVLGMDCEWVCLLPASVMVVINDGIC